MTIRDFSLILTGFAIGLVLIASGSVFTAPTASAASCPVDSATLESMYEAIFHRTPDSGASGYAGHDIVFVLEELMRSEEHAFYTDVFEAVKGIENARRNDAAADGHYDRLGEALGYLETWAAGTSQTQVPGENNSSMAEGAVGRADPQEDLERLDRAERIFAAIAPVIEEIGAELVPLSEELTEKKHNLDTLRDRLSGFNISEAQMQRIEAKDISEYNALLPEYNHLVVRRERLMELWYVIRDYAEFGTMPSVSDRADLLAEGISWD